MIRFYRLRQHAGWQCLLHINNEQLSIIVLHTFDVNIVCFRRFILCVYLDSGLGLRVLDNDRQRGNVVHDHLFLDGRSLLDICGGVQKRGGRIDHDDRQLVLTPSLQTVIAAGSHVGIEGNDRSIRSLQDHVRFFVIDVVRICRSKIEGPNPFIPRQC